MKLIPLTDKVLLHRESVEDHYGIKPELIVLPDEVIDRHARVPQVAEVMAIGPDVTLVQRGDWVIVGRWAGTDIKLDNHDHMLVRQNEILARVER